MRFLYVCYGKAGLDCLYMLLNQKECSESNIFVITYNDAENSSLKNHLDALHISYTTESIHSKKVIEMIKEFSPDYIFSVYFRDIIKKEVLDIVKQTSINLHPSLLPDYKGCFSAPWVLINSEKKTGITYHNIDEGVDSGNIIIQKELEINTSDTSFSLYHRLIALGTETFPCMFQRVVREGSKGTPQISGGRIYKREIPYGGYISLDWNRQKIHNFIRAMYFPPFPGAKLKFGRKEFEFNRIENFDEFILKKGISIK